MSSLKRRADRFFFWAGGFIWLALGIWCAVEGKAWVSMLAGMNAGARLLEARREFHRLAQERRRAAEEGIAAEAERVR